MSRPCVSVRISAGLGNRLFQVAAMLGYAEKHGHIPVFIREWIEPNTSHPGPNTILDFFPNIPVIDSPEGSWTSLRMAGDDALTYVPLQFIAGHVRLEGYFQSERYFPLYPISSSLLTHAACTWYSTMPLDSAIFLHVRRGDYLEASSTHHCVDLSAYFRRALSLVDRTISILVCSDDMAWCKATLPGRYADIVGAHRWTWMPENASDVDTLVAMTRCRYGGICANSTFSWWGAYMNTSVEKVVYMPATWGYRPLPPVRDLYPKGCIILSTDAL